MHTLKSVLSEAELQLTHISESPLLDAEVLLLHVLEKKRSYLRAWPERDLHPAHLEAYRRLTALRRSGHPVAYLTGRREFWSREFIVTPDVLIPRHETELLIELALAAIPDGKNCHILDLGTGSGIIAVTLAAERPHSQIMATDISLNALNVAETNAKIHRTTNTRFYQSDWFEQLPPGKFDLIVSNPPYIAEGDPHLDQGDLRFEPKTALVSPLNGLKDLQMIAERSIIRLNPGGNLMVEHGFDQQQDVHRLFRELDYRNIRSHHDLSGQPRVTTGQYLPDS